MSVGPMGGLPGSAAGGPLAQGKGSDVERAQQDTASRQRQVQTDQNAQNAEGIGQTEEDQQASDRDADGRRLWEIEGQKKRPADEEDDAAGRQSKDATGQSGQELDLTG